MFQNWQDVYKTEVKTFENRRWKQLSDLWDEIENLEVVKSITINERLGWYETVYQGNHRVRITTGVYVNFS